MASVDITKPTAAQRQIDAAIRILFSGEDVLAVHTVVAAAHRIVLDLREKRSGTRGQGPYVEFLTRRRGYSISRTTWDVASRRHNSARLTAIREALPEPFEIDLPTLVNTLIETPESLRLLNS